MLEDYYIYPWLFYPNQLRKYASYLESQKGSSHVYPALLKYGYSNFSLEILEYCEPDTVKFDSPSANVGKA